MEHCNVCGFPISNFGNVGEGFCQCNIINVTFDEPYYPINKKE